MPRFGLSGLKFIAIDSNILVANDQPFTKKMAERNKYMSVRNIFWLTVCSILSLISNPCRSASWKFDSTGFKEYAAVQPTDYPYSPGAMVAVSSTSVYVAANWQMANGQSYAEL